MHVVMQLKACGHTAERKWSYSLIHVGIQLNACGHTAWEWSLRRLVFQFSVLANLKALTHSFVLAVVYIGLISVHAVEQGNETEDCCHAAPVVVKVCVSVSTKAFHYTAASVLVGNRVCQYDAKLSYIMLKRQ